MYFYLRRNSFHLCNVSDVWSISAMRRILYTMVQFRPLRKPFRQTDFLHLIFTYFIESPSSSLCIIVASGKFAGGSFPGDFTCFSPSRPASSRSFDGSSRAHSPAVMSSHLGHFLDRISGLILPMKKGPKQCLLWQDSIWKCKSSHADVVELDTRQKKSSDGF